MCFAVHYRSPPSSDKVENSKTFSNHRYSSAPETVKVQYVIIEYAVSNFIILVHLIRLKIIWNVRVMI